MRILEEFWYGNIEPTECDTSSCKEYKEATGADLQELRKTQIHYDRRAERVVRQIRRLCARISNHYKLLDLPEQLQAGSQDDVGSYGRITINEKLKRNV